MARLRRVDPAGSGFSRVASGKGFRYLGEAGSPLRDPDALERIRDLVIPPAWRDVWICPDPHGHLQATGTDQAGRRQYLYHARWRGRRDQDKFERMLRFAERLPRMRRRVQAALMGTEASRDRVLACGLRLLDLGLFRVGSEEYTKENGSFGLATLLKEHVCVRGTSVTFDFIAKGGIRRRQKIEDPMVSRVIGRLKRRRTGGAELLAYLEEGVWVDVRSRDINEYLKELVGEEFTAKDFRTWHATVFAAARIAREEKPSSLRGSRLIVSATVKDVAETLGNTAAVCRRSYIDPRVFEEFQAGRTISPRLQPLSTVGHIPSKRLEGAVLKLLSNGKGMSRRKAA